MKRVALTSILACLGLGLAGRGLLERRFGLRVEENLPGVSVSEVPSESSAARYGLRRGDRIAEVGGYRVTSLADYEEALARNHYVGPAPVPFESYIDIIRRQSIRDMTVDSTVVAGMTSLAPLFRAATMEVVARSTSMTTTVRSRSASSSTSCGVR